MAAQRLALTLYQLATEPGFDFVRIYACHPSPAFELQLPSATQQSQSMSAAPELANAVAAESFLQESPAPALATDTGECGKGARSVLLGAFAGTVPPSVLVVNGGWARVEWRSDRSIVSEGWSLAWQVRQKHPTSFSKAI